MSRKIATIYSLITVFLLSASLPAKSQCQNLPYWNNFEFTNGGWTTGGIASDWEWGTPVKATLITLDGVKCWTTGGLTKNNYNSNQLSWLQSPCFDFTGVEYPYVQFRTFSSTEQSFDGATFEYSIDSGLVWQTAGSAIDGYNCVTGNWFNTGSVPALSNRPGWSGYFFWSWTYHSFPFLSGKSKVMFRFVFASNNANNIYDGFAIDDFYAGEADTTDARFVYECTSSNIVNFRRVSNSGCAYYAWDFDDPASGAANSSDLPDPTHVFTAPGQYRVTLRTYSAYNAPDTTTQIINILGLTTQVINQPDCKGYTNGVASVSVIPVIDDLEFSWSTNPVQYNDTVTNLSAGSYAVNVEAPNACPAQATIVITDPDQLLNISSTQHPACNDNDGAININSTGGTAPYSYTWSPNLSNAASAANLWPGNYSILVTDAEGCSETINILLKQRVPIATITNKQDLGCTGDQGSATVSVTEGEAPYSYSWSPSGGAGATAFFATGGNYTVTVTDNNGCMATAQAAIMENGGLVSNIIKQDATCGNDGKATANITGGVSPLTYSWTSVTGTYSTQVINGLSAGLYALVVTDANGCKVMDAVSIAGGSPIGVVATATDAKCFGEQNGNISVAISGGTPAYTVSWSNGSAGVFLDNLAAGNYIATVSDALGCTVNSTIVIKQPPALPLSLGVDTSICKPATIILSAGSFNSYTWQNGAASPTFVVTSEGDYSVTVTDAAGCSAQDNITIIADCGELYFPNAFTPDGNGLNELFGPSGNLAVLKKYSLKIFNRWGNLVFQTNNPFTKWDGKTGGNFIPGVYAWYAGYSSALQPGGVQKGTLVLIR